MNLGQMWRGDDTLGRTYWLGWVIPGVVMNIAFVVFATQAMALSDAPKLYNAIWWLLVAATAAVIYLGGIAVLRSAQNKKLRPRMGTWGWIASILVVIAFVRFPMEMLGVTPENDADIERQFDLLNVGLPKRIDDVTTMTRVSYDRKVVSYSYKVDSIQGTIDVQKVKQLSLNDGCGQWKSSFDSKELLKVEYKYLLQDGSVLRWELLPTDCF
jgi:hypothetical protein